ncbi:unnamed protein product [Staurois parvus]|uniref:Uncharacterized protein n=1 Tax=Staurois parvus TaxID=386267 RepID=A0ABN9ABR2_9NEOB|nr:unnamed protein product [Staurois parvus]
MHSGKYRSPCKRQTQTCPSDCQRSMIGHSREHVSTALESSSGWLSCCLFPVASTLL